MHTDQKTEATSELFNDLLRQDLRSGLNNARRCLLAERESDGHWVGQLSSSALSTATAIVALQGYAELRRHDAEKVVAGIAQEKLMSLVEDGRNWLVATQNADGGWGDTPISNSNISTTALVWAALKGVTEGTQVAAEQRCQHWLEENSAQRDSASVPSSQGQSSPLVAEQLARAISERYGRDRTFSVPILTTLALRGRLGAKESAWKLISQLPFELAACPHQMFAMLSLPVVSYALPALIAMGQVHHRQRPSRNPILQLLRRLVWQRTKNVLGKIQPTTGGFLEATPLTSFVIIALLGADAQPRAVIDAGIGFLVNSVRLDGSWPIDTNLATWVTTLSVNALGNDEPFVSGKALAADAPPQPAASALRLTGAGTRKWLLDQQYQVEHPYTHAKPGGWAWTHLSGGVPDADDTSGALLALRNLAGSADHASAAAGVRWLMDLQNRDGGVPTFCRGWGALPFDRSSADITAHAIRAWLAWFPDSDVPLQRKISKSIRAGLKYLVRQQRADGAWAPLWFGNQAADPEENLVYGTSRVLIACAAIEEHPMLRESLIARVWDGVDWLLKIQNPDGGWGSESGVDSSIEESGLAIEALCVIAKAFGRAGTGDRARIVKEYEARRQRIFDAIRMGVEYLLRVTDSGTDFPPSPIGFYFAKLWYYERLYPMIYSLAALESAAKLDESK